MQPSTLSDILSILRASLGALAVVAGVQLALSVVDPPPEPDIVTTSSSIPAEALRFAAELDAATTTTAPPPEPLRVTDATSPYPATVAPSIAAVIDTSDPATWEQYLPELTPLEADQAAWEEGYLDSGAPPEYLPAFWRRGGIVDCETDYRNVHSDTGDAGYAQINQIHRDLITRVTGGADWHSIRLDPYWNGFVAGELVERKADRGSNPYGDWFKTGHCHGLA